MNDVQDNLDALEGRFVSAKAAWQLAVRLRAYSSALKDDDDNGIVVWGNLLSDAQRDTGIEIYREDNIQDLVDGARRRLAKGN